MNIEKHPESVTDQLLNVLRSPLCATVGGRLDEVLKLPREKQQIILNRIVNEERLRLDQETNVS